MGPHHFFLEIKVNRLENGNLMLTQTKYISDILKKADMENCKGSSTPMTTNLKLTSQDGTKIFSLKSGQTHSKVSEGHKILWLTHVSCAELNITGYSDFDWELEIEDMKFTVGYCVYMGKNLISWSSKKQQCVSKSWTEAEYRGISAVVTKLLWHFKVDLAFVRDHMAKKDIQVHHIPGDVQVANMMTKVVSSTKFHDFCSKLRIREAPILRFRRNKRINELVK
ncbi:uncharacterized mitochondrial protein AtMg00810-like [Arachis hypogaea]|uniref:uncharacterized mitochondrial protein AtMg00810-like n=1 Tax=Arachis hypogaea TaxID=3818 RepID=UPI0010FC4F7F|nr:uncharacterized protein LOC114924706 [Arachis hypogaea]